MGANLIGYLVVGPKKLDPEKIEKAREHLKELHAIAERWAELDEDESTSVSQWASFWKSIPVTDVMPPIGDNDHLKDVWSVLPASAEETSAKLDRFVDFWNERGGTVRDVAWREHKEQIIMFCGEMSWGDEPSGVGHDYLKFAWLTNIDSILGFE